MQNIEIYQVDAFTDKVFHGNPAAVCLMEDWMDDELLQAIAAENNLSETAFLIETTEGFKIRWFTPNGEINICGHATLAAAYILFELGKVWENEITFESLSGPLSVSKEKDLLTIDFPRFKHEPLSEPNHLAEVIHSTNFLAFKSELDYMAVLPTEAQVLKTRVDLDLLAELPTRGLIITSLGEDADFYSRCFYPKHQISEDPVTGTAHCIIASYWAERLHKNKLTGIQGSFRKGEVFCEVLEERVKVAGYCRWYFKGQLQL